MSDASTQQSVECPICGEEFDPTVAGGWCTNTECGEWQYTGEPEAEGQDDGADGHDASDVFAATPDDEAEAEPTDGESVADDDGVVAADDSDESDDDIVMTSADGVETADDDPDTTDVTDDDSEWEPKAPTDDADTDDVALLGEDEAAEDDAVAEAAADDAAAVEGESTPEAVEEEATPEAVDESDPAVAPDDDGVTADDESADEEPEAAPEPSVIDCPDCGAELAAEANFCVECGADVQDVTPGEDGDDALDACPGCGADVDADDNFCVECGEDLDAHRGGDVEAADDDPEDAIEALGGSDDEPAEAPESLVLEVAGNRIPVEDGDKVGREIRAALMDAGRPEEEAVRIHREHVRFVREPDTFYLVDLGDNPTTLNGRSLTKGDREPVAPGDELELSGVATATVLAP